MGSGRLLRYEQYRFEEGKSEVLGALDVHEKLGATKDVENPRDHLRLIQGRLDSQIPDQPRAELVDPGLSSQQRHLNVSGQEVFYLRGTF